MVLRWRLIRRGGIKDDRWYHAHPEYEALWPMLKQLDIEELQRQLDMAHEQIEVLQRQVDHLQQQLRDQQNQHMRMNQGGIYNPSGFNTHSD